jgi:ferritin-like metal-binding protein YciE
MTLDKLLIDELKDLYNAENQLVKALPKLAKKASTPRLAEAFNEHLEETRNHVSRLDTISKTLGVKLTGKKCAAMEGLIEEGKEILEEQDEGPVMDAALIGAAQRVEHYEIAAYGTARTMAEILGQDEVARLLQQTLDEEGAADKLLTQISEKDVLPVAMNGADSETDEEEE